MVEPAKGVSNVDQALLKQTGIKFSEGSLKSLKAKPIIPLGKQYSNDVASVPGAEVELSNGAKLVIPIGQKNGAKVTVKGDNLYLEKLSDAEITGADGKTDKIYVIGCKDTKVNTEEFLEDCPDEVTIAHHADGTKAEKVIVSTGVNDNVHIKPTNEKITGISGFVVYNNKSILSRVYDSQIDVSTTRYKDGVESVHDYTTHNITFMSADGKKSVFDDNKNIYETTYPDGHKTYGKLEKVNNDDGTSSDNCINLTKKEYMDIKTDKIKES